MITSYMKKRVLGFFVLFVGVLFLSSASAQVFNEIQEGFIKGTSFLLGDTAVSGASYGEIMFIKFLVFILLFVIINFVLNLINRKVLAFLW